MLGHISNSIAVSGQRLSGWLLCFELHDFQVQWRLVAVADLSCQYPVDFWFFFNVA